MTTVLITGVAGFIGSHLSEKLLAQDIQVVGLDNFDNFYNRSIKEENLSKSKTSTMFKFYEGDIRDKDLLMQIFGKHNVEVIIHLAAKAGVRPSLYNPIDYISVNIEGVCSILEAARLSKIQKIIFGSSSSVYGTNKEIPFSEKDDVINLISPYALTKKTGEDLCLMYNKLYEISVISLRFFTVYGPRQRPDLAIHKFLSANLTNKEIEIFGDGTMSRDYTFVSDTVAGIIGALEMLLNTNQKIYKTYNLGNSSPIDLNHLIKEIEKTTGKLSKIKYVETPMGDVPCTYADITLAERELNYKPQNNMESGLKLFFEWMRNKNE